MSRQFVRVCRSGSAVRIAAHLARALHDTVTRAVGELGPGLQLGLVLQLGLLVQADPIARPVVVTSAFLVAELHLLLCAHLFLRSRRLLGVAAVTVPICRTR